MIPVLLIAGAALATGVVIGAFWKEIKEFLLKSFEKIKKIIVPAAIIGFKTYVQSGSLAKALYDVKDVIIQKYYSERNGEFTETIITRKLSSINDLPSDLREELKKTKSEVDISEQVQEHLELTN